MANILVAQFMITLLALTAFQFHECFWSNNDNIFIRSENNRLEFIEFEKSTQKECNTDCKVNLKSNHSIKKPRIDGGTVVDEPTQWPFFATLIQTEALACGGAIMDDDLVLTSKSCFMQLEARQSFIITNTTFRFIGVQGIVGSTSFSCGSMQYTIRPSINGLYRSFDDFVLVNTSTSLLNTENSVNKAITVNSDSTKMILEEDAACYIVSHTKNDDGLLRMVSAPVKILKCYLQDESQFCFEGSDRTVLTCTNDSGSPIVCHDKKINSYVLVGIVSTVLRYCNPNMVSKGVYNLATNISFIYSDYKECFEKYRADKPK